MKIAAFDLGSTMAVAHNLYETPHAEHHFFSGDRPQRASQTLHWLEGVFAQARVRGGLDAVVYERPFARGMHATRSLWGLAGLLEALAERDGVPCIDITPKEIKKHATGGGDASKADMILCASLSGYPGDNEHEADAWCLLRMAEDTLKPTRVKGKKRG